VLSCLRLLPQGLMRPQYAGVFPVDSNDFPKLEESIKRVRALAGARRTRADRAAADADGPERDSVARVE
jgi:hypothetical protein